MWINRILKSRGAELTQVHLRTNLFASTVGGVGVTSSWKSWLALSDVGCATYLQSSPSETDASNVVHVIASRKRLFQVRYVNHQLPERKTSLIIVRSLKIACDLAACFICSNWQDPLATTGSGSQLPHPAPLWLTTASCRPELCYYLFTQMWFVACFLLA